MSDDDDEMVRGPLFLAMGLIAVAALSWVAIVASLAAYDAMTDGDMFDGAWDMMGGSGGMHGMMGGGGGPETTGSASGQGEVAIEDFRFEPTVLTVTPGTVVKWTNADSAAHTATANDGSFDTGNLFKGEAAEITFAETGAFDYICTYHPQMKGRVVVAASP